MLLFVGLVTKDVQKGRLLLYAQNIFSMNDAISGALRKLDDLTKEEKLAVLAEVHQTAHKALQVLEALKGDDELQKCYDWLHPSDPWANHNAAQDKAYKSTAGSGKSILCSTIIENVLVKIVKPPTSAAAFFYFDFKDPAKQTFRDLLGSLLWQLSNQNLAASSVMKQFYKDHDSGKRQPSLLSLKNALVSVLKQFKAAYLVLDALDECLAEERQKHLFDFLGDIMLLDPVHVFATSRTETDIEDYFEIETSCTVNLNESLIQNDIMSYISSVLETKTFKIFSPEAKALARDTLYKQSHGMFLWVECQLKELAECVSDAQMIAESKKLPLSLEDTYQRILKKIPEKHFKMIHYILQWIAFAACPITMGELQTAMESQQFIFMTQAF
ncbi:hypothetical protein EVG20_g4692 [Dentipellis fragilis]|uniref:Nephrocystin 3-like N-terminal domain-containing protein n=1 Tax=Dentipellis fragilis TaxID=205917 RepID=A0A4Y9YXV6_9AGAM|nr:hypothetical protein EVG20_g4692 [Dentipellis fragilis]